MIRTTTGAEIYDLAWSPDGMYFMTGGMDNTARIFDARTGKIAHHRTGPNAETNRCHDPSDR
jgi:WD40 repeat protein